MYAYNVPDIATDPGFTDPTQNNPPGFNQLGPDTWFKGKEPNEGAPYAPGPIPANNTCYTPRIFSYRWWCRYSFRTKWQ